jgi:PAS domain S-box-containing protein
MAEAFNRTNWQEISAVILDRKLPDGSAEEMLPRLKALAPHAAVMVVTGYADLQSALAALRQGAADYILKPINAEALRASLLRLAERHRLALAKERSEAAFRTLVEAAPCMILILRTDHTIAYFSPFAERLTGYRAAEVLGHDFSRTFLPERARQVVGEEIQRIFAGTLTRGHENQILRRDGTPCWVVWNAHVLSDYEGAPALLTVGQDINQLKQAQEQALQSERLAAIGQMMTGLAHESGNALARSQACLEMLALEVEDRPEAKDLIARIQKAQDHLRQLYEEVRAYAAPVRLERESVDLASIWRQAWTNLAVARKARDTALQETGHCADLSCWVDPFRLEQVFRNIMENSLAACRDPVRLEVHSSETTLDGQPAIRLAVRDNGPGLNAEQKRRVFDPFYTTKTKGTGLGMAIARRIIEAHGGRIAVGQDAAPGAEIVVTLPRTSP